MNSQKLPNESNLSKTGTKDGFNKNKETEIKKQSKYNWIKYLVGPNITSTTSSSNMTKIGQKTLQVDTSRKATFQKPQGVSQLLVSSKVQREEKCVGKKSLTSKKLSKSNRGGGGGGGFKIFLIKLALSAGAVVATYKLNVWGSVDQSEELVNKIKNMFQ